MIKTYATKIACAATLVVAASSCAPSTSASETFNYSNTGIASVKIGADYSSVPTSCPGLYSRAELRVCCGGEDGEGVDILYYGDNSQDYIIYASLDVDQDAIEALYEEELICNDYPLTDTRLTELLQRTGSTKIGSVTVAPSPNITVNIDGQEIETTEPIVKFMELPGAISEVSIGEGLVLSCTIGGLTMMSFNAYETIKPDVISNISEKIASAMETGIFEPIQVSAADVIPGACFDYFSY